MFIIGCDEGFGGGGEKIVDLWIFLLDICWQYVHYFLSGYGLIVDQGKNVKLQN